MSFFPPGKVVARVVYDNRPGDSYRPALHVSVLVKADENSYGCWYYHRAEENPASYQWMSDEQAQLMMKDAKRSAKKPIRTFPE